ncbi:endonuclease [Roseiflexus sp.]|uniref:endonuclease n=1 Tax=Roseiflexus sp. TaxID=2562120 RepID=UPI00398ADED9
MPKESRYYQIIEHIFFERYQGGVNEIFFERADIERIARGLGIEPPKNIGDVLYSFRYRKSLPDSIRNKCPEGMTWIIRSVGQSRYAFVLVQNISIIPNSLIAETKIPDSTPSIVAMYALTDEQALLAKVRYNRLIDIFTGVTCYSLQNHLRTTVPGIGQIETDEIYIGIDRRGAHYVFPVQAKGGRDRLSIVQIEQDFALCSKKFPNLICFAIGAQFISSDLIAMFGFELNENGPAIIQEKHYRLVPLEKFPKEDIEQYHYRPTDHWLAPH